MKKTKETVIGLYCVHVGESLEFKKNKMELLRQSDKKCCSNCPTLLIFETYVCPKCGKEIVVKKNIFDLDFEERFEKEQKRLKALKK